MERSKYWELTTFQKAALTYEDLQSFRKVELMIKGIVCPQQPEVPASVPGFHEFAKEHAKTVTVVKIGYYEYEISEAAKEKLVALNLRQINDEYISNEAIHKFGPTFKPEVKTTVVYPEFSNLKTEYLSKYGDAENLKKAWDKYRKEAEEADKATSDLVDDWHQAGQDVALYERIQKTRNEYLEMTEGNEKLALDFLEKAFDSNDMEIYKQLSEEVVVN
jgi:hypothetical protein